jgi:hypothetical protein
MADALAKLVNKIYQCPDYQTLYTLEDDFNEVGLTIQTTSNNRIILCKIKDSKPLSDDPLVDYIYMGSLDIAINPLNAELMLKIIIFIVNAKGAKGELKNMARSWRDGLRMYEQSIAVEGKEKGKTITEGKDKYPMIED